MTIDELLARESIRQTMANYTIAGDRLRIEDFIAVFTEKAILETDGVPEKDAFRHEGRAQIRAWMTRWLERPEGAAPVHAASFIRHHLSTCQIELALPSSAKSRTYWTAYTDLGPDHCGAYVDRFEKVGDAWLLAHRRIRLDWRTPNSLHMGAVERTRG